MKANVEISAGICGFRTIAIARSEDSQNVSFEISTDCENIRKLSEAVAGLGLLDAYEEISTGGDSRLLACCRRELKGCCSGCAVPTGFFKAMQVAAGLALPQDIVITMKKGE
ncbi:MAG TPA: hypothetical protein PL033_00335 [Candidatus Brocadiia bacterium]|nr:hypothetical protein [Candidatus Brocadiia bacterium]